MSKNNIKLNKIIGYGVNAITYKIKIKGKYYVYRREKILSEDLDIFKDIEQDNLASLLNKTSNDLIRNIYFNKFINTLDTNHFLILETYKFKKADYKVPLEDKNKHISWMVKHNKTVNDSNYSFDIITDLKDGTLNDIYNILTKHEVYSLIIQIIYALHLMHTNDFTHNDVHTKNICYKKTKTKNIKILGLSIPTYGYIFSLIDYGLVDSLKFENGNMYETVVNKNAYRDNLMFLTVGIFNIYFKKKKEYSVNDKILYLINTIRNNPNDKSILCDPNFYLFESSLLNYEETKNYILLMNDEIKLIKYFYNLIKKK